MNPWSTSTPAAPRMRRRRGSSARRRRARPDPPRRQSAVSSSCRFSQLCRRKPRRSSPYSPPVPIGDVVSLRRRGGGARQLEASAVSAFGPVLVILPFCLLALFVVVAPGPAGVGRPVLGVRRRLLRRGRAAVRPPDPGVRPHPTVRRPAADAATSAHLIEPLWRQIAQANDLPADRYIIRVLPMEELNAFACGGHLVVVTTFALVRAARVASSPACSPTS